MLMLIKWKRLRNNNNNNNKNNRCHKNNFVQYKCCKKLEILDPISC